VPTGMTLLVQAAGRENLAKVMAAIGMPTVIAPILGPVLGGVLVQTVGWHAIFTINLPIGALTAIAAIRLLPRERPDAPPGKLDWIGLLLAAAGTVGITYGLSESATVGTFTARSVVLPILGGLVLLGVFVVRGRRIRFPLLDFALYRIRAYSSATVVMFGQGAALFAGLILLPLFFQVAQGQDVIHTGLMLIPQGIGAGIGSNRSAQATRWLGAGLTSLLGAVLITVTTVPFLFFGATTSYVPIAAIMLLRGFGIGMAMMPAMTAAFSVLSHDQVNDASPQLNVTQRVGGSLGTAVVAVILQDQLSRLGAHHTAAAVATAFNRAYLFVLAMSMLALIPAVFLWRIERKSRASEEQLVLAEEALAEVVL
jgi:EmrB/QacA subfamily drug resistance transporter